jgi:hypothetical protein
MLTTSRSLYPNREHVSAPVPLPARHLRDRRNWRQSAFAGCCVAPEVSERNGGINGYNGTVQEVYLLFRCIHRQRIRMRIGRIKTTVAFVKIRLKVADFCQIRVHVGNVVRLVVVVSINRHRNLKMQGVAIFRRAVQLTCGNRPRSQTI